MDYLQKVKEKEEDFKNLRTRQDADRDLLYLSKYVMKDTKDKKVPGIIHITLNRPAVFAANVISALGSTSEQRVVESEDKNIDTTYIENFQKTAFTVANTRLRRKGKNKLNPFFDEQICIRGGGCARCLFQMEKDLLIPDITPWDIRYVTYEMGEDGLSWAAYTTIRKKGDIEAEYGIVPEGRTGEVVDIWDREHNEVWIDKKRISKGKEGKPRQEEHLWGFTPVVLQWVTLGSQLADKDSLMHEGESIFFLIRDVVPELNRLVSILQTLNLKAVLPPMKQKRAGIGEPSEYDDVTGMATITQMAPGEDIAPIDYGDAKRSAQIAYAMFDRALQEGSLSSFDMGTFNQTMSAIALIHIGEGRDQVYQPRLNTKASLNEGLAEMFTAQCVQIGGTIELGTPGHKRKFEVSKLEGEYETTYKYFVKSPQIDMARYSMAASVGNLIPDKAKRIEILQREDPMGDEDQLRYEEAERLSPAIKMHRVVKSLVKMDEDLEAEILSTEMGVTLKQMLSGQTSQIPKVEEKEKTKPLPLFPQGGVSSAKKAADLQATPAEED